jgi:ubiquinone/menaquinone biosynthesis C-methylase UbiE
MHLTNETLKEYFRRSGTVEKWWNPEEQGKYRLHYIQERLDVIKLSEAEGLSILDVGTGRGRLAISFILAGAQEIVAVDISREMINVARGVSRGEGVADKIMWCLCDAEHLPLRNESFDLVCCIQIFPHLPNLQVAIDEVVRVCKREGVIAVDAILYGALDRLLIRLYFGTPKRLRYFVHRFVGKPKDRLEYRSVPLVNYYSRRKFLSAIKRAGLRIKQCLRYDVFFLVFAERQY